MLRSHTSSTELVNVPYAQYADRLTALVRIENIDIALMAEKTPGNTPSQGREGRAD